MTCETPRPPSQSGLPSGFSVTSFGCKQNHIYHFSNPPLSNLEACIFGKASSLISISFSLLWFTSSLALCTSQQKKKPRCNFTFLLKVLSFMGIGRETFVFHLHYSHPDVQHLSMAVSKMPQGHSVCMV